MSGPRGVRPCIIHQRSKGCIVRLGIIQWSIQKVAYVRYFGAYVCVLFTKYDVLFVSVCPVVPSRMSALKDKIVCPPTLACVRTKRQGCMSANPSVRPV
jgi:hypothetical protein